MHNHTSSVLALLAAANSLSAPVRVVCFRLRTFALSSLQPKHARTLSVTTHAPLGVIAYVDPRQLRDGLITILTGYMATGERAVLTRGVRTHGRTDMNNIQGDILQLIWTDHSFDTQSIGL